MTDFEEMVLKYLADIVDMMRGNMYTRVEETIQKPVVLTEQPKAKYTWYKLRDGGKVRKCNNEPCPYYLKWNDEKKTYEHGKYDPNTESWSYVNDRCEFYGG